MGLGVFSGWLVGWNVWHTDIFRDPFLRQKMSNNTIEMQVGPPHVPSDPPTNDDVCNASLYAAKLLTLRGENIYIEARTTHDNTQSLMLKFKCQKNSAAGGNVDQAALGDALRCALKAASYGERGSAQRSVTLVAHLSFIYFFELSQASTAMATLKLTGSLPWKPTREHRQTGSLPWKPTREHRQIGAWPTRGTTTSVPCSPTDDARTRPTPT